MTIRKWISSLIVIVLVIAATGNNGAWAKNKSKKIWHQSVGIGGPVVDILFEPVVGGGNLFAVVQGSGAGIYRSVDGGTTFTLLKSFTKPYKLALSGGARLWAATSEGLYRTNNLTTWTQVLGGLPAGAPVTYVARIPNNTPLYATVGAGTARGLYRSVDNGVSWTLVIPKAATQAVTQGSTGCGTADYQTVLAGGKLALGGPSCTLLKSTDGGSSFTCTSYPHTVNDLGMLCVGYNILFVTSPEVIPSESIRQSVDLGETFVDDAVGIIDSGATNIDDPQTTNAGRVVGTSYTGIFERKFPIAESPWTQFSTEGLLDQRINRWVIFQDPPKSYYVVATPTGVFYFK